MGSAQQPLVRPGLTPTAHPPPSAASPCRLYRGLYLLNWIYRYLTEPHYRQWIVWASGLAQTGLYADFFYYYFLCWKSNSRLHLPA